MRHIPAISDSWRQVDIFISIRFKALLRHDHGICCLKLSVDQARRKKCMFVIYVAEKMLHCFYTSIYVVCIFICICICNMNLALRLFSSHFLTSLQFVLHFVSLIGRLVSTSSLISPSCYHDCSYSLMMNDTMTTIACAPITVFIYRRLSIHNPLDQNEESVRVWWSVQSLTLRLANKPTNLFEFQNRFGQLTETIQLNPWSQTDFEFKGCPVNWLTFVFSHYFYRLGRNFNATLLVKTWSHRSIM